VDDYLGALQHYHNAHAHDPHVLEVSRFIIDYPFETRLFPHASQVVRRFKKWGKVVIVSDGDVVFQLRKIELAGLYKAVDGHVLIYTHKEQELVVLCAASLAWFSVPSSATHSKATMNLISSTQQKDESMRRPDLDCKGSL